MFGSRPRIGRLVPDRQLAPELRKGAPKGVKEAMLPREFNITMGIASGSRNESETTLSERRGGMGRRAGRLGLGGRT